MKHRSQVARFAGIEFGTKLMRIASVAAFAASLLIATSAWALKTTSEQKSVPPGAQDNGEVGWAVDIQDGAGDAVRVMRGRGKCWRAGERQRVGCSRLRAGREQT